MRRPTSCAMLLDQVSFDRPVRRVVLMVSGPLGGGAVRAGRSTSPFRPGPAGFREQKLYRGMHPMMAKRLELWRLRNFYVESPALGRGRLPVPRRRPRQPEGRAAVRPRRGPRRHGRSATAAAALVQMPHLERMLMETMTAIRARAVAPGAGRPPAVEPRPALRPAAARVPARTSSRRSRAGWAPRPRGSGCRRSSCGASIPDEQGEPRDTVLRIAVAPAQGMSLQFSAPSAEPIRPLTEYAQKVVRMRQRGLTYPVRAGARC